MDKNNSEELSCPADYQPTPLTLTPPDPGEGFTLQTAGLRARVLSGGDVVFPQASELAVKKGASALLDIPKANEGAEIARSSPIPERTFDAMNPDPLLFKEWYAYYCDCVGRKLQMVNEYLLFLNQRAFDFSNGQGDAFANDIGVKVAHAAWFRSLVDLSRDLGDVPLGWPLAGAYSLKMNGFSGCLAIWNDENAQYPGDPRYSYGFATSFCLVLEARGEDHENKLLDSTSSIFKSPPPPPPPVQG